MQTSFNVFYTTLFFLAQIMPFSDIDLEKFYAYVRLLITKLPQRDLSGRFKLHDEVALDYYRLQKYLKVISFLKR